jgi:hypothetical protein
MGDTAFICRCLRTATIVFLALGSPAVADEATYRDCVNDAVGTITNHIIEQCRKDMARIMAETGKTKADLSDEEQTCEATAKAHSEPRAKAECADVLNQPPLKR